MPLASPARHRRRPVRQPRPVAALAALALGVLVTSFVSPARAEPGPCKPDGHEGFANP